MKRLAALALLIIIMGAVSAIHAEPSVERLPIYLQSVVFDPLVDGEPVAPFGSALQQTISNDYYLVQFRGPTEPAWVEQIEQLGGAFLGYIPEYTHLMRIAPEALERIQAHPAIRWIGIHQPVYKLSTDVLAIMQKPKITLADNSAPLRLVVVGYADGDADTFRSDLQISGATEIEFTMTPLGPTALLSLDHQRVINLVMQPSVAWVEYSYGYTTYNSEARTIIGVDSVWEDYGYYGSGQIVAISDSGLSVQGALNADFAGRLVRAFAPSEMNLASSACRAKTTWTDINGHGTHVAGSVLGSGRNAGSNPAARQYMGTPAGVAPEAQLVFMSLNTDGSSGVQCISPNGDFITKGYEQGARISSNSWGGAPFGAYDLLAHIVDGYIWNHRDYLVLFAAGNGEPGTSNTRATIGSPGTAKNVLTVGATENLRPDVFSPEGIAEAVNPERLASFSSRGPTNDGRIKPDIVAPGTTILSVRAEQADPLTLRFYGGYRPQPTNANYAYARGTSMATPLTAGAAALMREWLITERRIANPSAALMKALLIHGAAPLSGTAQPNLDSGWGRVDLKNTLNAQYAILADNVQGLTTGQTARFTVEVVGSSTAGMLVAHEPQQEHAVVDEDGAPLIALRSEPLLEEAVTDGDLQPFAEAVVLPGYTAPSTPTPIPAYSGTKDGIAPLTNNLPQLGSGGTQPLLREAITTDPTVASLLTQMIGGGTFEDPDWTTTWQRVWLGQGKPLRTIAGQPGYSGVALNGNSSIWLGGSVSNDFIWYPLSFPATIAGDFPSRLSFLIQMRDLDPTYDFICVAIVDATGAIITASDGPIQVRYDQLTPGQTFQYNQPFSAAQRSALAGKTGYLVLYNTGDAAPPHASGFIDDIMLYIDFPDVTLTLTPNAGPPGTTFLLRGQNNVPNSAVDVCSPTCGSAQNLITRAFADARGNVEAYLSVTTDILPGNYAVQTRNVAGRTAQTTLTIITSTPTLTVSPESGRPGTSFQFTGSQFLPNDPQITVRINSQTIGTVGSAVDGTVSFSVTTRADTPAGVYTIVVTDHAGRSASATYTVQSAVTGQPTLTVNPPSGQPGTSFTFTGRNFTPNAPVAFTLDGQALGDIRTNAIGEFAVTLRTSTEIRSGTYTLTAAQRTQSFSVDFRIEGTGAQSNVNGIFATLVWTDPPPQMGASRTLVNNLDLTVIGPDGQVFHGNGNTSADTVNTVETVGLNRPLPGVYTISVTATSVDGSRGAQPFALVVTTGQSFTAMRTQASFTSNNIYLPILRR